MPKTRWPKISYTLTHQTPFVTQSSAKCGFQMRSQKPVDIWFRTSKRAVVGVVTITGPEAYPPRLQPSAIVSCCCCCCCCRCTSQRKTEERLEMLISINAWMVRGSSLLEVVINHWAVHTRTYSTPLLLLFVLACSWMNELLQLVSNWW